MKTRIYTAGICTPDPGGHMAAGFLALNGEIPSFCKYYPPQEDNNRRKAELYAVLSAIQKVDSYEPVTIMVESATILHWLNHNTPVKDLLLNKLTAETIRTTATDRKITFEWVPTHENQEAHTLCKALLAQQKVKYREPDPFRKPYVRRERWSR